MNICVSWNAHWTHPSPDPDGKTLFTQEDGAERIKQFAAQYSAPVWVAMEYRYMPPVAALIDHLDRPLGHTDVDHS